MAPQHAARPSSPLLRAAAVLGIGLGAFFDGIVFHQLLQWHHMLSTPVPPDTVPNLRVNTLLDGAFHATAWLVTAAGVWLLLRSDGAGSQPRAGRVLVAGVIGGWGGFNLVEGLIDHYLLGIHHVRPGPDEALYDLAFLLWGVAFIAIGAWLARSAIDAADRQGEGRAPPG